MTEDERKRLGAKYDAVRAQVQAMEKLRSERDISDKEAERHGRAVLELIEIETALKQGKEDGE
jgi:hypothetical protein